MPRSYGDWSRESGWNEESRRLRSQNEELSNMPNVQLVRSRPFYRTMLQMGLEDWNWHIANEVGIPNQQPRDIGNIGRRYQIMIIRMAPSIPLQVLDNVTPSLQLMWEWRHDNWQHANERPREGYFRRPDRDARPTVELDQQYIMESYDAARDMYADLVNQGTIDDERNVNSLNLSGEEFDLMQSNPRYWGQIANLVDRIITSGDSPLWTTIRPYLDMAPFTLRGQTQMNYMSYTGERRGLDVSDEVDIYIDEILNPEDREVDEDFEGLGHIDDNMDEDEPDTEEEIIDLT